MLSLRVVYWSIYGILGSIIDQFTVLIGHELLHFYVILGAKDDTQNREAFHIFYAIATNPQHGRYCFYFQAVFSVKL